MEPPQTSTLGPQEITDLGRVQVTHILDILILLWIWYDLIATIINIQQYPTMSHEPVPMFVDTSHLGTASRRISLKARSTLGEISTMGMWNPVLMVKFPMNIYEFQSTPHFWLSSSIFLSLMGEIMWDHYVWYPLVNVYILPWKDPPIFHGKIHYFYGHFPLLFVGSPEGNPKSVRVPRSGYLPSSTWLKKLEVSWGNRMLTGTTMARLAWLRQDASMQACMRMFKWTCHLFICRCTLCTQITFSHV